MASHELTLPTGMKMPAFWEGSKTVETIDAPPIGETMTQLRIRGNRWRIAPYGGEERVLSTFEVDCVLLAASPEKKMVERVFYSRDQGFQPGIKAAPRCASSNGIEPDSWDGPGPIAKICAACPQNVWGTAIDQAGSPTKGKACSEGKRLFLVIPGEQDPVYLRLPPTSLGNYGRYVEFLRRNQIGHYWVVTKLRLDPGSTYPVVEFSIKEPIPNQEAVQKLEKIILSEMIQSRIVRMPEIHAPGTTSADAAAGPGYDLQQEEPMVEVPPEETAPVKEEPKVKAEEPPKSNGQRTDSRGVVWDPAIHATAADGTPSATKAGVWRKKRGVADDDLKAKEKLADGSPAHAGAVPDVKVESVPSSEPKPAEKSSKSELDNIFSEWGT